MKKYAPLKDLNLFACVGWWSMPAITVWQEAFQWDAGAPKSGKSNNSGAYARFLLFDWVSARTNETGSKTWKTQLRIESDLNQPTFRNIIKAFSSLYDSALLGVSNRCHDGSTTVSNRSSKGEDIDEFISSIFHFLLLFFYKQTIIIKDFFQFISISVRIFIYQTTTFETEKTW